MDLDDIYEAPLAGVVPPTNGSRLAASVLESIQPVLLTSFELRNHIMKTLWSPLGISSGERFLILSPSARE